MSATVEEPVTIDVIPFNMDGLEVDVASYFNCPPEEITVILTQDKNTEQDIVTFVHNIKVVKLVLPPGIIEKISACSTTDWRN